MVRTLLLLTALVALLAAPSAHAAWQRTTLPPEVYWAHDSASTGLGEVALLHRTLAGTFATIFQGGQPAGPAQQLDSGWNFYPTVDASAAGGAVAAWYNEDAGQIRVAERAAAGGPFTVVAQVEGGRSDYSYGHPLVRVNDRGDALVVYLASVLGGQEVRALFRPAGGEFGAAQTVAPVAPWSTMYPRDAALAPDGTAVVGLVRLGRAHVATRPAGGAWGTPVALGEPVHEHSWQSPRVGIDAAGNVAAAWLEDDPDSEAGPVRLAHRPAGGTFAVPRHTGMTTSNLGRIRLGVSAPGELVLLVEAEGGNEGGGTYLQGLQAITGNTLIGAVSQPGSLSGMWGSYPSFAMNSRGDAVMVYDECCPMAVRARRRLPLAGFGPIEDVQPPIAFEGWRSGIIVRDADVDELGNARTTYEDGELDESYLATALPAIVDEPPAVPPLGDLIPPLELPLPLPEPELPDVPDPTDGLPVVGTGWSGVVVPPPPPPPPGLGTPRGAPDRAAPALTVAVASALRGRRAPRLSARVGCSERCTIRLSGTFARSRLRPVQVALERAGRTDAGLTVGRAAARRAARDRRARVARIVAVATDAAGNATTRRIRVSVRL